MLASQDEFKLKAVTDVLEQKLVKRKVPLKGLTFGPITPAAGSTVRQEITLQQGIPIEKAREIVKAIKDSKKKVQASIQGDLVRVSGKDRDTLQEVIALLRGQRLRHRHAVHQLPHQLMPRRIESLFIDGPAGKLEALLEEPEDQAPARSRAGLPSASAARRHHAQQSGLSHRARHCAAPGAVVLRFNYRGVNLSEGKYDDGVGELEDARAALEVLAIALSGIAVFAGRIFLRIANHSEARLRNPGRDALDRRRISRPATRPAGHSARVKCPRVFIQSTHDQFGPRERHGIVLRKPDRPQGTDLDRSARSLLRRRTG